MVREGEGLKFVVSMSIYIADIGANILECVTWFCCSRVHITELSTRYKKKAVPN